MLNISFPEIDEQDYNYFEEKKRNLKIIMINKITVELNLPNSIRFQYLGSILHGVLMDYLPNDIADQLHHEFAYSPLKQRIYHKTKSNVGNCLYVR